MPARKRQAPLPGSVQDFDKRRAVFEAWLLERGFAGGADLAHLNPDTPGAARLYGRLGFTELGRPPGARVYAMPLPPPTT